MNGRDYNGRRRFGSVKAAVNMYGERMFNGSSSPKKTLVDYAESSSRGRDLHMAKREKFRYRESKGAAESAKARAESELLNARKSVRELSSMIEESNSKAEAQMRDMEMLKKKDANEERALVVRSLESYQYAEVMRELEFVRQELSKLKLDMASVMEVKTQAEKEREASCSKLLTISSSVEGLKKEIEAANEEQVLVELARIEALKEYGEIEAQREKESSDFSFKMEETKKTINDLVKKIDQSKELENKLAVTIADVNALQNELQVARKMDRSVQSNDSFKLADDSFQRKEELEGSPLLQSITDELQAAKKELASVREEGFGFMASMDIIRSELKHVSEETARLKKTEEKRDSKVQNLKSKLLRAKSKLDAASAAEEKATSIVSNLTLTLEQLKAEAEAAKKEKALIVKETTTIKEEIQKTECNIDITEERLRAAMQELEVVKSSEASALENLKNLTENTMRARAAASQHGSSIVISKFEYDYLTGRANGAEEIADKKVAASQAWIEALKSSEREILMKCEMAHRDIREMRVEEEKEVYRTERSLSAKRMLQGQLHNWGKIRDKSSAPDDYSVNSSRKSMKTTPNLTPSRRAKLRKSASPAYRMARSGSFTVKKKKVIPNLAKFFKKTNKHI